MIRIDNLLHRYAGSDGDPPALRGVSLHLPAARFAVLVGRSGSGKSTLLNMMGGLDRPSEGNVVVNGIDLRRLGNVELDRFRAATVGFIFQDFGMLPDLTAFENVEFPLVLAGVSASKRRARALGLLERIGMADKAMACPSRLSGGQQQRVAIARALVANPPLVLADEPSANLDSGNAELVMRCLVECQAAYGTTIVVATHDPRVREFADIVVELRDGAVERVDWRRPAAAHGLAL